MHALPLTSSPILPHSSSCVLPVISLRQRPPICLLSGKAHCSIIASWCRNRELDLGLENLCANPRDGILLTHVHSNNPCQWLRHWLETQASNLEMSWQSWKLKSASLDRLHYFVGLLPRHTIDLVRWSGRYHIVITSNSRLPFQRRTRVCKNKLFLFISCPFSCTGTIAQKLLAWK